ncbi:hypothetical protein HGRIS_007774 [Hohenbuehelia grisea]|uniref:Galactinol synthase n=1 Tax=Hohenbuehelia grisea TaxID=104357 RepID=A0ABR3J5W1_9AGAR
MVVAAYVTLLTKASYLAGTLVVEDSLKAVGSKYPLVVMIPPTLPEDVKSVLRKRNIQVVNIDYLEPEENAHTLAAHDERFKDTWTKLRAFELTAYERVVLMDSDMIVLRNMDELLEMDLPKDWIAAAHACACNPRKLAHYPADWIPANCAHTAVTGPTDPPSAITTDSPRPYSLLNSGLVVINPSTELADAIKRYLYTSPEVATFSFPDQDLLAAFFKGKWKPLHWYYNALKTLRVIHKQLWRDEEIRCLHYILHDKPWHSRPGPPGTGDDYEEMSRWWWEKYEKVAAELKESDVEGWRLVNTSVAH